MLIKNHSREIIELRRRSNALLAISQLPDSLLAEIFGCYKELHEGAMPRLVIVRITHVCYSWRAIASSYSTLWADIYPVRVEQVRHWLERSACCPLDLETRIFDDEDGLEHPRSTSEPDALRLALEELPRIQTLSLHGVCFTQEQLSAAGWTNSSVSLPLLQSLTVDAPTKSYAEDVDDAFCLTTLFLLRDLPSLTKLEINDDRFLSHNMRFPPSLTCLNLSSVVPTAAWDPDMVSVILSVLDTLPSLEFLELSWNEDGNDPVAMPTVKRQVTLHHLQQLSMGAFFALDIFAYLLDCLVFPSSTIIHLTVRHRDQLERTSFMRDVAGKLNGHGLVGDHRPLRKLVIKDTERLHTYMLMGGRPISQSPDADNEWDVLISFTLCPTTENTTHAEIVHMICDTFSLQEVGLLTLSGICVELGPDTLMTLSRSMPMLCRVYIEGWTREDSDRLPTYLFSPTSADVEGLFPKVKQIILGDLHCYPETIGFWDFLVEFLASRKESGDPIKSLCLLRCENVGPHYLKPLRESVEDLCLEC